MVGGMVGAALIHYSKVDGRRLRPNLDRPRHCSLLSRIICNGAVKVMKATLRASSVLLGLIYDGNDSLAMYLCE